MKQIRNLVAALFIAAIPTITMGEIAPHQAGEPILRHKIINWNGETIVIPEMYTIYYPILDIYVDYYCEAPLCFDCLTNSCQWPGVGCCCGQDF